MPEFLELINSKSGWRVDFFIGLGSFEILIAGTRRLLDLALRSSICNGPNFVFVSSISVFKSQLLPSLNIASRAHNHQI